jgi:hypothetical protein
LIYYGDQQQYFEVWILCFSLLCVFLELVPRASTFVTYLTGSSWVFKKFLIQYFQQISIFFDSKFLSANPVVGKVIVGKVTHIRLFSCFSGEANNPHVKQRTRCKISIKTVTMCSFVCYFQGMN